MSPVPNWIAGRCANPDDFGAEGSGNAVLDFGKFCTGFLVVMGIGMRHNLPFHKLHSLICVALPVILAHSQLIVYPAMVMSIIGGLLIYGTIISFGMFFQEEQEF